MKQISLFAKIFMTAALMTVVFLSLASYAGTKALDQDPELISKIEKQYNMTIRLGGMSAARNGTQTKDAWSFAPPTKVLRIKNVSGNFHVKVGSGKELTVSATGELDSSVAAKLLETTMDGDTLTLQQPNEGVRKLEVHIEVPSSFKQEFEINTVSGNVNAEGMELEKITINSVSGDMNLNHVSAKTMAVKTVSGEIEMEGANIKNFEGTSVSGELKLANLNPLSLKFKSVSGDVKLKITQGQNAIYNLRSLSGKIENKVGSAGAGKSEFSVDVNTTSGDIEVE